MPHVAIPRFIYPVLVSVIVTDEGSRSVAQTFD